MKRLIGGIFAFSFSILCSPAFSSDFISNFVSRSWTSSDGIPGNTVNDIIQDKKGYILAGTYGGLVRFDGEDFSVFNSNSGYSFASARCILESSDGAIWIGSNDEGLSRIILDSTEKEKNFSTKNGFPSNSIRALCEDSRGNIWAATANGVVYVTKEFKIERPDSVFQNMHSDLSGICTSIFADRRGRVWVSTNSEGGIYKFENGHFSEHKIQDESLSRNTVCCVGEDSRGELWFGISPHFAIKGEGADFQTFDLTAGKGGGTQISSIVQDSDDNIWFGTDFGVSVFRNGEILNFAEDSGIADNKVNKIFEDREGNIWLATDNAGLQKFNYGLFKTTTLSSGVNSIAEGKDGRIWLGLDSGVACYSVLSDNSILPQENAITEFCKGERIRHIGISKDGDILVSSYNTLGQMIFSQNGNLLGQWGKSDGLTGNKVRVAIQSKNGDIYIGTTTGLNIVKKESGEIRHFTKQDGFSNEYVMWLFEDENDGRIYVGTDGGGVIVLKDEKIERVYSTDNGLAGNIIFKITKESDGAIWICTGTGISRLYNGNIVNFGNYSGLEDISIFQMIPDKDGNVWFTSKGGVSSELALNLDAHIKNKNVRLAPKFYGRFDGLRTKGVNSTSLCLLDSRGLLWFTLVDGFAICNPKNMEREKMKPTLNIESVFVDDVQIFPKDLSDKKIVLPAGTKRLYIKYTGLSFTSTENVLFKTKLDGFDSDFSKWTAVRHAVFTNLKPGKYQFRLVSTNGDGVISDEDSSLIFEQKAFFYEMIWFWILIASLVAFLIVRLVFVILSMTNQLKRLKNAVAELSSGNADLTKRVVMKHRSIFKVFDELVVEENRFLEKFQGIIGKLKDSEETLKGVGVDMEKSTQDATNSLNQVLDSIDSVHYSIESQDDSVRGAASAVNRIAENIDSLRNMISVQTQGIETAAGAVEEMVSNIRAVNSAMDNMADLFSELESGAESGKVKQQAVNQKIAEIEEKSKTLRDANTTIALIANQTNLLAMNAAIEAAHAGDAGRGFAVVAEEIRKLSETSSAQSKQIGEQLKGIRASIDGVVSASEESSVAFGAVSDEIARTNKLVRDIKISMGEQADGSKQVLDALKTMKENSAEVNFAAQEMSNGNSMILESMSRLKESSGEMKNEMDGMVNSVNRANENGGLLLKSAEKVKDAIEAIDGQMIQFTV